MQPSEPRAPATFSSLGLAEPVLAALADVGYEAPTPIQAETIPALLAGADLLGQAQTGTGKTAAFALPALCKLDLARRQPQTLVLVPTRELALQVAEAFQKYAAHLTGFHVLPVYGGQSYQPQLAALRRGVHVVVGTPGRVIDHLDRGTLDLSALAMLVLDEADEMLQMGFLDAVERVLESTPSGRQVALFSATLPTAIRRIAQRHLRKPTEITIRNAGGGAAGIRQRYWLVSGVHKLDALTRILETERFDALLAFTRTKLSTVELAGRLAARGFAAEALNGDVPQAQRERIVERLKGGDIDVLVATDVAARGLDVERISHVVNYDLPYDVESYVHRIGRTGRAGRSGEAILFVAPRERGMLRAIERATRQPVEPMNLPSIDSVNLRRLEKFKQRIVDAAAGANAEQYRTIVEEVAAETGLSTVEIAAALAAIAQGPEPLLLSAKPDRPDRPEGSAPAEAGRTAEAPTARRRREPDGGAAARVTGGGSRRRRAELDERESFRVEVGAVHGVRPSNLVGAIANEAGIDGAHIGRIEIREDFSLVDLPVGMPERIFRRLQRARVLGRELQISRAAPEGEGPRRADPRPRGRGARPR
ncbi:MAG: DEAD/DEAH box helicase [Gammaproteobacteria bacterium]|nr:DEAD/DEAH box helicase [Gammaproteobacteria bacterium]